jgi:quercetin dioxygenase-like cupin family protein
MKKIKDNQPETTELGKSESHLLVQIIKYIPKAVVSKTILKKLTGNITATSVAIGETIADKTIHFDTFIQIIDGAAEVIINNKKHQLKLGNCIIIPANAIHSFKANEQFKMLSTIIKSGYEELTL